MLHRESIIRGRPGWNVPALFLTPLSFVYGLIIRLWLMSHRGKPKRIIPGFVLSIGNLTVGGTGKTPAACMLAEWGLDEGYKTAILSRGYGGSYRSKVFVLSDGYEIHTGPEEAGDEPFLLARRLRGVPVVVSKNRYLAGLTAHKRFKSRLMILDDGFQHIKCHRDLDIVLMDASRPIGNGHLLPLGPLREPVKQLRRADVILLTGPDKNGKEDSFPGTLGKIIGDKPVFRADRIPEEIVFPFKKTAVEPGFIKGRRVVAFAGIAGPDSFRLSLLQLGADVVFFKSFSDHHPFHPHEIHNLRVVKEKTKADFLITTEKDWVRLEGILSDDPELAYLTIRFALLSEKERFFNLIRERIREKKDS